jgi:hypothetical protein
MSNTFSSILALVAQWKPAVREFIAGASMSWAATPYILLHRREIENLFMLMTILNPHGTLPIPAKARSLLLPYAVPQILHWRRRFSLWDDSLEYADLKHIGH